MENSSLDDTIYAPATPPVNSPIAVIRISGNESFRAVENYFSRKDRLTPRHAYYGSLIDGGTLIDDVILVYYQASSSFTGEDMVEIYCHGNQFIVSSIVSLLRKLDMRIATPGEFSKRAFINGKIDLTEAEAINNIITATSQWEVETSIRQMHGSLKLMIHAIRDALIHLKADIECGIDFSDQDIEIITYHDARDRSSEIETMISETLKRCRIGEKLSHGIDVTIAGKPNVGKSSILNLILNQERAIVSHIPGTTRDLIRESVQINGLQVNLTDTAGIGKPGDEIEKIGIELSHRNIHRSALVLLVLDGTSGIDESDRNIMKAVDSKPLIYLINKMDIASDTTLDRIQDEIGGSGIPFSALEGTGMDRLESELARFLTSTFVDIESSYIADMRIIDLLEQSLTGINDTRKLLEKNEPEEIIAFELQTVLDSLGEITGEITPDDVLASIFSRFCIGK